jgi:hypothetical protein
MTKTCTTCLNTLPLSDFPTRQRRGRTVHIATCLPCRREASRKGQAARRAAAGKKEPKLTQAPKPLQVTPDLITPRPVIPGWWRRAACTGMDSEVFFVKGHPPRTVIRTCARCPVARSCLEAELRANTTLYRQVGYRGGATAEVRRQILEARGAA